MVSAGSDSLGSMTVLVAAVASVFGLMFGSAINALVWRLYVGRSWVRGRSICPDCEHELRAKDLVPVVSWVLLRGRCRYCKKRIHWQYPVVELVTAVAFGWSAYLMPVVDLASGVRLGLWLVMLVMLIVLATYDARWLLLPDKVMVPVIAVALVFAVAQGVLSGHSMVTLGPLVAAVLGGGFFYAIVALSKGRAMGGGDIKLVFAMGLILGLKGLAVALLLAFNVAAVVGVWLIVAKRRGRKDQIPFGPYLVGATVVAFWYAQPVVAWYLRANGL